MVIAYDHLTNELKRSRIKLNDELLFAPQQYGDGVSYHIEVPSASRFFRIGYREYVFISLLNGETSFVQALAITAQNLGADAITELQATQIVNWLFDNGLAHFADDKVHPDAESIRKNKTSLLQKLNPFWWKIPLGQPDEILERMQKYVSWVFHPLTIALSMLLMLFAILTVFSNWDAFVACSGNIFSTSNWIWMLVTWVVLKVVHELAHGLVCNRFGGRVRETGIIFILFAPMAYVDVTSSWRFASRWRRIAVAGAGIYVELLIASVCVLIWCITTSEFVAHQLFNVVLMASISTLLFNANPLMRFDGYFILSDLMKIPNLYEAGSKSFQNQMRWLFFGQQIEESLCEVNRNRFFVAGYGICAAIWKVLICIGLSIAASVMFGGLGILLAAFGVASWFGRPAWKLFNDLVQRRNSRPHTLVRAAVVAATLGVFCISSWFLIPNPFASRNPCLVDFRELSKVRAHSSGFITEVFVTDGQNVDEGDPLLKLENRELTAEVEELRARLKMEITRERIAVDERNPAGAQIARRNQMATRERLVEKELQLNGLIVKAETDGQVVARGIGQTIGTFVNEGDVLLTVANEDCKEILLSLSCEDVRSTSELIGQPIPVEFGSRRKIMARIARIEPQASVHLQSPSLAATHGGRLAVKAVDASNNTKSQYQDQFELCEPRFHVIAEIDADVAKTLFAGERGNAVMNSNSTTLGQSIYNSVQGWLRQQLAQAKTAEL